MSDLEDRFDRELGVGGDPMEELELELARGEVYDTIADADVIQLNPTTDVEPGRLSMIEARVLGKLRAVVLRYHPDTEHAVVSLVARARARAR